MLGHGPVFSTTWDLEAGRSLEILLGQVAMSKQSSTPVFRKSKWRKPWTTDEGSQVDSQMCTHGDIRKA